MSNESTAIVTDIDLDDWVETDDDEETSALVECLDGRRRVENKLDDLRLRRETSEFDFHI